MKAKIDWTRARNLMKAMGSHARCRLAGQILLGKELLEIKRREGLEGSGGDRRSKAQNELLKTDLPNWGKLCRDGIGISKPTADRYITRFKKAAELAANDELPKKFKKVACILLAPSAELTGDEVEALAEFVEEFVDDFTRKPLEIELGITLETDDDEEEDSGAGNGDLRVSLEQEALIFFASLPRKIAAMRKAIAPFRDYGKYQIFLHKLPLDDGRDGMPSLLGIKEGLEAVLKEGLSEVISDVGEAIEAKMSGKPAKPGRKTPTRRRK